MSRQRLFSEAGELSARAALPPHSAERLRLSDALLSFLRGCASEIRGIASILFIAGSGEAQPHRTVRRRSRSKSTDPRWRVLSAVLLMVTTTHVSATTIQQRESRYPAHWWTPVSTEGKPEWEILPQEAGPGEVILSKRHELGLLSNFAATPFTFRGRRYASLEGFWQMMLYPEGPRDPRATFPGLEWKYTRAQVAQMTAFEAKTAGTLAEENMKRMGINWATFAGKRFPYRSMKPGVHYRLIVAATWAKVEQNPEVRKVLLATGDLILRPDHHSEPNAPPEWRYFEILTRIRNTISKGRT